MKGGQGDKCRAEDPNNCRFHHTGRFAQTKAALSERRERVAIPPPFDKGRAQSLLKYAFAKPMELVKYAPPELEDFELKEDARKLPVAKAIAAVLPYADIFGKGLPTLEQQIKEARSKVYATRRKLFKEVSQATEKIAKSSPEDERLLKSVLEKNKSVMEHLNSETRDLESRAIATYFSVGDCSSKVKTGEVGSRVDKTSLATLKIVADRLFDSSIIPNKAVNIETMNGERSVSDDSAISFGTLSDAETLVHEYSHFIEYNNKHVHDRCVEFLDYRCGDEKSKSIASFGELGVFLPTETARKDNFFHVYCGKDYIDKNGNRVSTEIFSMGVEMLVIHPQMFYERDREYFAFIVGLMKGKL